MASIAVIVENVLPTAHADADTNLAFEDEQIMFDASNSWDTPSDIVSFLWDFGDGTQTTYVSPTHAYQNEGEYEVSLTAMDMFGGESKAMLSISVTNIEPGIVETNVTGMHYPGKPLHFAVTADDTPIDVSSLEYTWDFHDGTITHEQNVIHIFQEAGIFNVTVSVTDNNGASDSANILITISNPEITTSVSSTLIFQDETVFFNAFHELDDGSFVYTWHFSDGYSAEGKNVSHPFNKVGIFTPWLMVSEGKENYTIFLPEIKVQNVVPVPVIQPDKLQVTEDETVRFNASESWDSLSDLPHITYTWDFCDDSKGAGNEVIHVFPDMGNYTVTLTVSDGKTTGTTEVQIEVQNLLPVADSGTPKERKATVGELVILDASGTIDTPSDIPELNYTWKIGNDTVYGKVVSYMFSKTGEFTVSLIVRDNNGATSKDTITFRLSKESESDDAKMSTLNWILVVVIIVFLVVIGFLLSAKRDETLYREMKAEEEAIVVEGEIDEGSFKPKEVDLETSVEVVEGQEVEISGEEVEVVEEESENVTGEIDEVVKIEEKTKQIAKLNNRDEK